MQFSTITRVGIIVGFVAVLVLGSIVGLAFANDSATYNVVPQNTYVEGVDLSGMDADEATEALQQHVSSTAASVVVSLLDETTGDTFDIPLSNALVYDIDAAVQSAIELNHSTPSLMRLAGIAPARQDMALGFKLDEGILYDQIAAAAPSIHVDAADAWRDFNDDNTVTVHPEKIGRELNVDATFSAARERVSQILSGATTLKEAASSDLTVPMVADYTQPYLTVDEFAPAIIVDYSEFKLYVFEGEENVWWCWIGYGRGYDPNYDDTYDSPTGLHYIEYKDPSPIWINPDPEGWGAGRPDVIEAGPDNPLGLRALKISDAPMIFIHGVNYTYLLGQRLSHGCINVYNDQIVELYDMLPDPYTIKDNIWVYFHDYPEDDEEVDTVNPYSADISDIDEEDIY